MVALFNGGMVLMISGGNELNKGFLKMRNNKIKPGDIFFDKLDNNKWERCILQETTLETPDRNKIARGGTGEFYRPVSLDEIELLTDSELMALDLVFDIEIQQFVHLRRI